MKMRKSIHKFLALALAICMLVPMLAACKQEIDAAAIMSQYRLSNSAIELSVGDVSGVSLVDESLSDVIPGQDWSSDNPAVATVVGGIITAVGGLMRNCAFLQVDICQGAAFCFGAGTNLLCTYRNHHHGQDHNQRQKS